MRALARRWSADVDELGHQAFLDDAALFSAWIARYLVGDLDHLPVLAQVCPGAMSQRLAPSAPVEGRPLATLLEEFVRDLLPGITHWNHPGFFAYFPSSASAPGVLGEYLTAALNQQAMLWRTSPTATELEGRTLDWLRELIGLPPLFTGVAYDGGSMANLHGLLAARQRAIGDVRLRGIGGTPGSGRHRVYVTEHTHSSIDKAAIVLGLGQHALHRVACDQNGRMDPAALRSALCRDRGSGDVPVAVVATAGTTGIGAVDPLDAIASVCAAYGLWLHVDASWAGAAAMLPECADRFRGIANADSVVINPHKWLFAPLDLSVCYFRDVQPIKDALSLQPAYLRHADAEAGLDMMDRGIALGRRFRGLKLWLVLSHYGVDGLRARLREHLRLAQLFADAVDAHPHLERIAPVAFSLVCFRAVPPGLPAQGLDGFNRALLAEVNAQGEVFLSGTLVRGVYVLRFVVGHVRTREQHVRQALDQLDRGIDVCSQRSAPG